VLVQWSILQSGPSADIMRSRILGWNRAGSGRTKITTKEKLGIRAMGREVIEGKEFYELREPENSYRADFGLENDGLRQENKYFWDLSV